jgi:hypothetical protein
MSDLEIFMALAKEALVQNRPEEALAILDKMPIENAWEAIFMKGEIYFKLQRWGEALNHFSLFHEQFPSDKRAEAYCVMIQNILDFYDKDQYNP